MANPSRWRIFLNFYLWSWLSGAPKLCDGRRIIGTWPGIGPIFLLGVRPIFPIFDMAGPIFDPIRDCIFGKTILGFWHWSEFNSAIQCSIFCIATASSDWLSGCADIILDIDGDLVSPPEIPRSSLGHLGVKNIDKFQFRRWNIIEITAAIPIPLTLFSNLLKWNLSKTHLGSNEVKNTLILHI